MTICDPFIATRASLRSTGRNFKELIIRPMATSAITPPAPQSIQRRSLATRAVWRSAAGKALSLFDVSASNLSRPVRTCGVSFMPALSGRSVANSRRRARLVYSCEKISTAGQPARSSCVLIVRNAKQPPASAVLFSRASIESSRSFS